MKTKAMAKGEAFLPAEWHEQSAVQLTWPHEDTDWAPIFASALRCYIDMAAALLARVHIIIVSPKPADARLMISTRVGEEALRRATFLQMPTNDTWARDHGFITLLSPDGPRLLDFRFNGWGEKFPADLDNQICRRMADLGVPRGHYESHQDFVLEGGSIESDGRGTILTTSHCLLAPHRNQPLTKAEIEERLLKSLHARRVLWLDHGYLAGDDTDSHIDTLARFCPDDTIAYVKCFDPCDEHFEELQLMEEQLRSFRTLKGKPYRLIPLPMVRPIYDDDGQQLPATYANFLVTNGAVLMPTYRDLIHDLQARSQLRKAFPNYDIVDIDCLPLITQHGSLHCCTMQFPRGDNKKSRK